jgi:hypothetical protein
MGEACRQVRPGRGNASSGRLVPLVDARERMRSIVCLARGCVRRRPPTRPPVSGTRARRRARDGVHCTSCGRCSSQIGSYIRRVPFFFDSFDLGRCHGKEHGWWVFLSSHWSVRATSNGVGDDEGDREPVTTVAFSWRPVVSSDQRACRVAARSAHVHFASVAGG